MLPLTRSRNRARFFGTPFSPEALFAGGTVAGAWYDPSDLTTLFTTSAGTTQCAMPGQGSAVSVGLMLDKSQGLVLGPELVTNGDFPSGTTGWSNQNATLSVVSGQLSVVATTTFAYAYQTFTTVPGKTYKITFDYNQSTANIARYFVGTSLGGAELIGLTTVSGVGSISRYFVATTTTTYINFGLQNSSGLQALFDNISVREIPGNHAIAFNDITARPELRARVNLLTYSEEINNSDWTKTNATITADAVANPLTGTINADALFETTTSGAHATTQVVTTSAARFKYSAYLKANGRTRIAIAGASVLGGNLGSGVFFDLSTGSYVSGAAAGATPAIVPVVNDWWLVSYEWTANANSGVLGVYLVDSGTNTSYAGDVTKGIYIWGADLRPANIGANVPAYQRIADANTYDTSGFPLYLRFDGIDDSMYTPANLNLSGTDKVAVFAGVRKLAAGVVNIAAELSANSDSNSGAFGIGAPVNTKQYYWQLNAGNRVDGAVNSGYDSPITNVLTGNFDIAGTAPIDEIKGRLNGVDQTLAFSGVVGAGSGNFGTYPLYIGSRGNSNFFFNGHLHSLIIAGSAVSAGNISATEQWVAGKTGITI